MPIHSTPGGGEQWGGHGKVYRGPGAKAKAEKQAAAAHAHGFDEPHKEVDMDDSSGGSPTSTQTLIFAKTKFKTAASARAWAKKNGKRSDNVRETGDSWRLQQKPPGAFDQGSFRTIDITDGVKAVVGHAHGKPKGKSLHIRADLAAGGSLHVRHMRDGSEQAETLVELAANAAEGSAPVWIQIAKRGNFFKGDPFVLDDRVFDDIIQNFNATANRRVPIDFEHASESDPAEGNIPVEGAPAQGWITAIEKRPDGLYGLVEWLPLARDYIRSGQYRYFSPAIRFNSRDRNNGRPIGAKLSSGALTNKPFLDGMRPLAARDDGGSVLTASMLVKPQHEVLPMMRHALGLGDLATHAEMRGRIDRLSELYDKAGDAHGIAEGIDMAPHTERLAQFDPSPDADVIGILQAMDNVLDAVLGPLDDDQEDASAADMADTGNTPTDGETQTMAEPTESTITLKDHEAKVSALELKLKDAESKRETAEAEIKALRDAEAKRVESEVVALVDTAYATYKDTHKLTEAHKAMMLTFAKTDRAGFDKLYPAVPPAHRHLLRDVTPRRDPNPIPEGGPVADMKTLTEKYRKEGLSLEAATSRAYAETKRRTG